MRNDAKMMAWTSIVLGCVDQLRHRVAFALSQILVIGENGFGRQEEYEIYGSYYDIFVRNAFGTYYDVLREVAYSPMMAAYLSFHNNRAFASRGTTPDENFAREIMQLFSIGLYILRDDGTIQVDSAGNSISTYDNNDIMNFARVWTGA
jgi:cullin-associated NEDD8-dissociated protein 1